MEGLLEEFVWRWLRLTDESVMEWVNQAIRQDKFTVRGGELAEVVPEDNRHSVSVIDIFRSFNQVVENLIGMEWDDDLQYAKFMTALSNSMGKGVAKYCESLEQMFAREMDRLTPEQEAALNQTTQEKLMQFAKDTWTNKDKIEPFQFSSEVCFKLSGNSIEGHFNLTTGAVVPSEAEQHRVCSHATRSTRARNQRRRMCRCYREAHPATAEESPQVHYIRLHDQGRGGRRPEGLRHERWQRSVRSLGRRVPEANFKDAHYLQQPEPPMGRCRRYHDTGSPEYHRYDLGLGCSR